MRQLPTVEPSWTSAIIGHLVFTAALLLTVIVASGSIANSNVIVALLAVSIPALVAWLYIESTAWVGPETMCRVVRAVIIAVAATCSFSGFFLTIWSFSRLAAFLVLLQVPLWYLIISTVAYLRGDAEAGR